MSVKSIPPDHSLNSRVIARTDLYQRKNVQQMRYPEQRVEIESDDVVDVSTVNSSNDNKDKIYLLEPSERSTKSRLPNRCVKGSIIDTWA